jgi:type IX secretion system PorP/SprF family membrane protein
MKQFLPVCLLLVSYVSTAQQLPLFSQYREFAGIINPAAVSNDYLNYDNNLSFGASYRRQWITDQDGPSTQVLRADYIRERAGISLLTGGYILKDQVGRVGTTGAYGRIGGIISNGKPREAGIAFGLNAGIVRYGLDLSNARLTNPSDIAINTALNKTYPDVGLGVYAYQTIGSNNMLYGGISIPQTFGLNLNFRDQTHNLSITRIQHYYATAGYKMGLNDEFSFVEFSAWLKYVAPLKPHADFNVRYQMSEIFYVGAGIGTSGFSHLEAGLLFGEDRMFRVNYSYDAPFTKVSAYYGASHEISVAYALRTGK